MRIIPFEFSFEYWKYGHTFEIQFLHFDWPDGDTSLLGGGWHQGEFWFDCCFWWAIKTRLLSKIFDDLY
jgi:hypothetical protein